MSKKIFLVALLMLSLMFLGTSWTMAATFDVDMGDMVSPCGGAGASDIGFVDCTNGTGGILINALTTITAGDSVRWTMRGTPHTASSQTAIGTGGAAATACATGDLFDSGIANAFTPGFVYTRQFNSAGNCAYYCILHPSTMQGIVTV